MARNNNNEVTGWVGWAYFAGILMSISGVFSIIAGFTALLRHNYYLVGENTLVAFNYHNWGWIHIALGIILFTAGSSVMRGGSWGRFVGIVLASLSAVANFAFLSAYPIWSIIVIIVDVLVIYALAVHGAEARED